MQKMQSSCYHGFFEAGITGFSWCVKTVKSQAAVKSQARNSETVKRLEKSLVKTGLDCFANQSDYTSASTRAENIRVEASLKR